MFLTSLAKTNRTAADSLSALLQNGVRRVKTERTAEETARSGAMRASIPATASFSPLLDYPPTVAYAHHFRLVHTRVIVYIRVYNVVVCCADFGSRLICALNFPFLFSTHPLGYTHYSLSISRLNRRVAEKGWKRKNAKIYCVRIFNVLCSHVWHILKQKKKEKNVKCFQETFGIL